MVGPLLQEADAHQQRRRLAHVCRRHAAERALHLGQGPRSVHERDEIGEEASRRLAAQDLELIGAVDQGLTGEGKDHEAADETRPGGHEGSRIERAGRGGRFRRSHAGGR